MESKKGYDYQFPEHRIVNGIESDPYRILTFKDQINKIMEEAAEVYVEDSKNNYERCIIEILDVIHACETALRMAEKIKLADPIDVAYKAVIEKNDWRGYYGEY